MFHRSLDVYDFILIYGFSLYVDVRKLKDSFSVRITVKLLKHEDPRVHDVCENYHNGDFSISYPVTDGKVSE